MSKFFIFRENVEKAVETCVNSVSLYRSEHLVDEAPSSLIQGLVNQHITPLCGKENILDIQIPENEVDWRKEGSRAVFRRALLTIVRSEETDEQFNKLFDCLDIALCCSEENVDILDSVTPMALLEKLLDIHTTAGCEKIFDYIIKRKARITLNMMPGRGKGLVLLRMCNELLRRLSKEINTVFCGRILMFLANSFPLGERSGVNLKGEFNTEMIKFDSDEQVDADSSLTDEQKAFYKEFWSTRVFFSNPPIIFQNDNFEKLQKGTDSLAERFKIIGQKETEILGARRNETDGLKRTRNDSTMDEDPCLAEEILSEINRDYHFPRLLSSKRLLGLEMEDSRFRRNIIVQYLILFQYLSGFSQKEREKTEQLLTARGTKQQPTTLDYTLSEEQIEWIDKTRDTLEELLRNIKPHGNLYTDIILTILAHERHWIIWKASNCPAFEKPPISIKELEKLWSSKKPRLEAQPNRYRYSYGNPEVSKLYSKPNVPLSSFMLNRPAVPSPVTIIDKALAELDDSLDPSKERFDYANGVLLQVTRLMYSQDHSLIRKVYDAKHKAYKDMQKNNQEDTSMKDTEETPAVTKTAVTDFIVGEVITEDHVQAKIKALKEARSILLGESVKPKKDGEEKVISSATIST